MAAITNADAPTNVANIVYDLENWQWTWGHVADTAGDVAAVSPLGTLQGITKGGKLVGIALVSGKEIRVITNTAEDAAKVVKNKNATSHGRERMIQRGFREDKIDDIINNYSQKVYQEGGRVVYAKKTGNFYDVVIVNAQGEIITTVVGNTQSLKTWKDVARMLNNNGGYSSLPW